MIPIDESFRGEMAYRTLQVDSPREASSELERLTAGGRWQHFDTQSGTVGGEFVCWLFFRRVMPDDGSEGE